MPKKRKGIILAGGTGTRLWPISISTSKHLLPIYDKPLIYYPLTTLMLADIKDILIITTLQDKDKFFNLLKDGSQWGLNIQYKTQSKPRGIAEALILGEEFINNQDIALILGDNIFYGSGLRDQLLKSSNKKVQASVFAYNVKNPNDYGVCKFDKSENLIDIKEKPKKFISNWVLTGLYFYDCNAIEYAKKISKSKRKELEITSINLQYLKQNKLNVEKFDRGYAWLDAGTPETLLQASHFVNIIEERQGLKIGCPEEVAFRTGLISVKNLELLIKKINNVNYKEYLKKLY